VTIGGSPVVAAVSGTTATGGSAAAAAHTQLRFARLVKSHGRVYLVVRVASTAKSAKIRIVELNKRGQKLRSFTATIATNRNVRLAIPLSSKVRVADVKLA
jgi:acyl dehydratase